MTVYHPASVVDARVHATAVAAARDQAAADGAAAVVSRFKAALFVPNIKGNGKRMAAALDLLIASPEMSGADIADAVRAKNVIPIRPMRHG